MRLPRTRIALLTPLLALAACGGSTLSQTIYVNPPDASVYMNGVRVQKGMNRSHEFDFSKCDRILIQAISPGYELRPLPEETRSEVTAARLIYRLLGYIALKDRMHIP